MITLMPRSAPDQPRRTGAVVALKPATIAKTRLGALPAPIRQRLAIAMALDTLTALAAAVSRLVVVSDQPTLPGILSRAGIAAELRPEPDPSGMNAALAFGAQILRTAGCDQVLACVGDLPALTPEAVRAALAAADDHGESARMYVPDRLGDGTTMLIANGTDLDPRFQGESASAHRDSGAAGLLLGDFPQARTDVDAPDDVAAVIGLGVGRHTAQLIDSQRRRIADYLPVTVAAPAPQPTGDYAVITDTGVRAVLSVTALDAQIRMLRPGQRLHAAAVGEQLISAWM
jgi:2-phospho-L-lactate guanylyltransferase